MYFSCQGTSHCFINQLFSTLQLLHARRYMRKELTPNLWQLLIELHCLKFIIWWKSEQTAASIYDRALHLRSTLVLTNPKEAKDGPSLLLLRHRCRKQEPEWNYLLTRGSPPEFWQVAFTETQGTWRNKYPYQKLPVSFLHHILSPDSRWTSLQLPITVMKEEKKKL